MDAEDTKTKFPFASTIRWKSPTERVSPLPPSRRLSPWKSEIQDQVFHFPAGSIPPSQTKNQTQERRLGGGSLASASGLILHEKMLRGILCSTRRRRLRRRDRAGFPASPPIRLDDGGTPRRLHSRRQRLCSGLRCRLTLSSQSPRQRDSDPRPPNQPSVCCDGVAKWAAVPSSRIRKPVAMQASKGCTAGNPVCFA